MNYNYDTRYMRKKFLGEIKGPYSWFRVYSSGMASWVILTPIDKSAGVEGCVDFVYPRKAFRRGVLPPES